MSDPKRWRDGSEDGPPGAERLLKSARPTRSIGADALARTGARIAIVALAPSSVWPKVFAVSAVIGIAGILLLMRGAPGSRQHAPEGLSHTSGRFVAVESIRVAPAVAPASNTPILAPTPADPSAGAGAPQPSAEPAMAPRAGVTSTAPHPGSRPQRAVRSSDAVAPTVDSLARESTLLRPAHDALSRDPRAALSLLRAHAREFPEGQLAQEREWIAFDALRRLGRNREARRRGEAFIQRYPRSYNAERIRLALAELP